jgi:hypothetical protein
MNGSGASHCALQIRNYDPVQYRLRPQRCVSREECMLNLSADGLVIIFRLTGSVCLPTNLGNVPSVPALSISSLLPS